ARLARRGVQSPGSGSVGSDQKRSAENIIAVGQSGLGLPDRDYYLLRDAKTHAMRQAYQGYVAKLFSLASQPDVDDAAARVLALETAIAAKHWDRARNRDRNATYNKMSVADLAALSPGF